MKKQIGVIILVLVWVQGFAQLSHVKNLTTFDDKKIHFGFTIGINTMDFSLRHWSPIGQNPDFVAKDWNNIDGHEIMATDTVRAGMPGLVPGLTVGIVTNLRLGEYFDLRFLPGLSFGERRLVYNVPVYDNSASGIDPTDYYSIKATFIDLPLLVKYKSSRLNNQRPYLIAGPALRLDISKSGKEELVQVKRAGLFLEGGIGLDSYLRFFRFSTELKVSLGLGNVLGGLPDDTQRTYYSQAIQRMTSNVFTLSFHFE